MKSFFMPLTEPLGAIWLLMAAGTAWLLLRRKWRNSIWLGVPTLLLFLVGSTPFAEALVSRAERSYIPDTLKSQLSLTQAQPTPWDAVVVLGGRPAAGKLADVTVNALPFLLLGRRDLCRANER